MFMIREVIRCKPGKVGQLADKFRAVNALMVEDGIEPFRLYTDYTGEPFWTLVVQREFESVDAAQALEAQVFGSDAAKEASHKAFCDKEMKETKAKKEEKESDLDTLGTKIDKATAKIAKLKEEIATLQEDPPLSLFAAERECTQAKMSMVFSSAGMYQKFKIYTDFCK